MTLSLHTPDLLAQPVTLLHMFDATATVTNTDGANPHADLVLSGNTLYGTTPTGGTNGFGTVFTVNTNGSGFVVLRSFGGGVGGALPGKDLLLSGNTLYGTDGESTNPPDDGAIYSLETDGSNFALVYPFTSTAEGSIPMAGVALSANMLYGTTYMGGISNSGSIFSIDTNNDDSFNPLHLFNPGTDGRNPFGSLIVADGTLYGTARNGGTNDDGTVFSFNLAANTFTVLHTFLGHGVDGELPDAGLILSTDTLYGTTAAGGTNGGGGTVFSIGTNGGNYTILHSFNGATDGKFIEAGLVLWGNTLYGTALVGSSGNSGAIYSVNTDGSSFTVLHAFSAVNSEDATNSDGAEPYGTLVLAGNILYGTASEGGPTGLGVVFSFPIVPRITAISVAGSDLVLSGINSMAGDTYTVLSNTNIMQPLGQWTPVATNILSSGGNFTLTVTNALNPATAQQYYALKVQ